jgi:hypothetical protein
MQLIYSNEMSLLFGIICEHIDEFPRLGTSFLFAVEIGLLHSQPFMKSHFHFLVVIQSANHQLCLVGFQKLAFSTLGFLALVFWGDRSQYHPGCPFGHFLTPCTIL